MCGGGGRLMSTLIDAVYHCMRTVFMRTEQEPGLTEVFIRKAGILWSGKEVSGWVWVRECMNERSEVCPVLGL